MAGSVVLPFPITGVTKAEEKPSRTYRLDLDKGRIYGHIDGIEAVEQAIRKALLSPRFKCLIYDHEYGSELEQAIIVDDGTHLYTKAVAEGLVRDALSVDSRITAIRDFMVEQEDESLYISFTVSTKFGELQISEVV